MTINGIDNITVAMRLFMPCFFFYYKGEMEKLFIKDMEVSFNDGVIDTDKSRLYCKDFKSGDVRFTPLFETERFDECFVKRFGDTIQNVLLSYMKYMIDGMKIELDSTSDSSVIFITAKQEDLKAALNMPYKKLAGNGTVCITFIKADVAVTIPNAKSAQLEFISQTPRYVQVPSECEGGNDQLELF